MADLVDSMTAAELRTKLAEYGLPVMPITASTRNLMAKKLKLVMESKGEGKNADSRRSLAKYSSGEDSDMDVSKASKEKSKSRRTTVGGAMLPPVTSKLPPVTNKLRKTTPKKSDSPAKLDDKDSESDTEPIKTQEETKTITTRRVTRTYKTHPTVVEHEDYETGSDSDVDVKSTSTNTYKSPLASSLPYKGLSGRSDYISSSYPSTSLTSELAAHPVPSYSYTSSSDLNNIRSRLGLSAPISGGDRPSLSTSYSSSYSSYKPAAVPEEVVDSPYLSSFTRRLSALKTDTHNLHKDSDNSNGSSNYAGRSFYKSAYKKRDYAPDFKTAGEKNVLKNNLVSFAIVGVGLVFFLCVSFLYLGMKGDVALHIEDKNTVIPLCQNIGGMRPSENCIKKEDVSKATDLLKIIYPALHARAVGVGCGQTEDPIYMTDNNIVHFVEKDYKNANEAQILEDLRNLHVLILNNPKWGISILAIDSYQQDKSTALTSMEYVLPKRNKGQAALAMLNATIPWRCSVTRIMYYLSFLVLVIGGVGTVAFLIHKGIKTYVDYTKRRKDQIYSMVEQIIDVLSQENAEEGADPAGQSMPVSHVRDMLIPPQNREKLTDIWEAAIKFLEKNESRVRFEVESVAGEEYRALRWVSPQGSPRAARGPGARSWQGQAFETQEGSVNNLTISPTPCLKIRHMVDKNDKNPNLKAVIQDAILEKCGPQCKILHMEIDKVSCCVYVKCASPADAGIVYQSLHGWWYEGNLITVKYLRLERYMDHFPSSPATGPYLKSSSQ